MGLEDGGRVGSERTGRGWARLPPEAALGSTPARGSARPKPKWSHGGRISRDRRDRLARPSQPTVQSPKLGLVTPMASRGGGGTRPKSQVSGRLPGTLSAHQTEANPSKPDQTVPGWWLPRPAQPLPTPRRPVTPLRRLSRDGRAKVTSGGFALHRRTKPEGLWLSLAPSGVPSIAGLGSRVMGFPRPGSDAALLGAPPPAGTEEDGVHAQETERVLRAERIAGPGVLRRPRSKASVPSYPRPASVLEAPGPPAGRRPRARVFKRGREQRARPRALQPCLSFDSLSLSALTVPVH